MIWIHGGGFEMGNPNENVYGPDYLVEKEVLLVTINYRVGALGITIYRFFFLIPIFKIKENIFRIPKY